MQPRLKRWIEREVVSIPVGTQFTSQEVCDRFDPRRRQSPTYMQVASYLKESRYAIPTGKWAKGGKSRLWERIEPNKEVEV